MTGVLVFSTFKLSSDHDDDGASQLYPPVQPRGALLKSKSVVEATSAGAVSGLSQSPCAVGAPPELRGPCGSKAFTFGFPMLEPGLIKILGVVGSMNPWKSSGACDSTIARSIGFREGT